MGPEVTVNETGGRGAKPQAAGVGSANPRAAVAAACFLAVALIGVAVRADVVVTAGQGSAPNVRIIGLRNGQLFFRLPEGREVSRPINAITYLQVTDWVLFNLAEKQRRGGHLRQATNSYEKVLDGLLGTAGERDTPLVAGGSGGDERTGPGQSALSADERALLVQCRLLRAYDELGRFDRAVGLYLAVIERMPTVVKTMRPAKLPGPNSTFLTSALAEVNAAIERHEGDAIAVSLRNWRGSWPGQSSKNEDGDAQAAESAEPKSAQRVRARLPDIREMVEDKEYARAL